MNIFLSMKIFVDFSGVGGGGMSDIYFGGGGYAVHARTKPT